MYTVKYGSRVRVYGYAQVVRTSGRRRTSSEGHTQQRQAGRQARQAGKAGGQGHRDTNVHQSRGEEHLKT
jgi:hypothetical protein